MKLFSLLFLFSLAFIPLDQKNIKSRTIFILSCESGILYKYEKNQIIVEGGHFLGEKIISKQQVQSNDIEKINALDDNFFKIPEDELLSNDCVVDGFHFKIFLKIDNKLKRILISNYYDSRIDSLLKIFDKYINVKDPNFQYNRMGYGDNSEELIESQNSCGRKTPDSFKQHLLQEWCEMEKNIK